MTYAIRFENVSKRYPRGGPGYVSLRHDIVGKIKSLGGSLRGKPRPDRGNLALEDISFEVTEGESFAIIGPNGAGKTTALKLVSRISYPTGGRVRVRGRVGALIEVGSGVHPELSGRENIWLYGQILGMSKSDVQRRFDDIVDFAELGDVMDRPVKMYSSGMQLRLGFSIASFLDPEIFVVDEALAVGDAGFQTKCVERMTTLVREGRTLVFVSHSLPVVREICSRGILLDKGKIAFTGPAEDVVDEYLARVTGSLIDRERSDDVVRVTALRVTSGRTQSSRIATHDPVTIEIEVESDEPLEDVVFGVALSDGRANNLATMTMLSSGRSVSIRAGSHTFVCWIPRLSVLPGNYELLFAASSKSRPVNYAQPQVIGVLVISEGPEDRRGDLFFGKMGGFGPMCVNYHLEVLEGKLDGNRGASAPIRSADFHRVRDETVASSADDS